MMIQVKSFNQMQDDMEDQDQASAKFAVETASPNLTAKIIEDAFKCQTYLCGHDVIVCLPPSESHKINDELIKKGVNVLGLHAVNTSLEQEFHKVLSARRGTFPA
jgi:hypothetical protein